MTLREIITIIGFNVDTRSLAIYDKAIEQVYRKTDEMYKGLNRVANGMTSLGTKMSIGLTLPIAAIGTASVMASASLEQTRNTFEVMLGSAEDAKTLLDDLFQFEAKTPFNIEDVLKFSNTLVMMETPLDKMTETLTMLGEVSAGKAPAMEGIMAQLFQVKNLGYASLQDIKPISNWGVPIIAALSKVLKTDSKGVMKAIGSQKVTYEVLMQALESISKDRTGLMAKQSKTLNGLMSTLQSSLFKLRVEFGDLIVEEFQLHKVMQWLVNLFDKIVKKVKELPPWQKKLFLGFTLVLAAIGPLLFAMGTLLKMFLGFQMGMAAMKFLGFAGGIKGLIPLLGKLSAAFLGITWQLALWAIALGLVFLLIEDIVGYFQGKESLIIPAYMELWKGFFDWYQSWGDTLYAWWTGIIDSVIGYFRSKWEALLGWYMNNPVVKFFMGLGGKMAQSQREVRSFYGDPFNQLPAGYSGEQNSQNGFAAPPPPGYSPKGGAPGVQIMVNTGDLSIGVPEGTSEQQKQAISDNAASLIKLSFMDEMSKKFTSDLLLVTQR